MTDQAEIELQTATVSFSDWLACRELPHLSTNAGAPGVAFQNWRKFKEAFAPELIGQAYEETSTELGRTVRDAIDPFGGSGTTALACQFLGVRPTTIEVNPYLADLIEAKLATYDVDVLIASFRQVVAAADESIDDLFPGAPLTFVEPGISGRYLFSRGVAERLACLRNRILSVEDDCAKRLMRVLLGAIALDVSHVVVSGKGRRYRKRWSETPVDPERVDADFADAVLRAIYEIQRYQNRQELAYTLHRGDARQLVNSEQQYDMAVFSPPYPNSFDYTDVYNIELWVCGYLSSSSDNRNLRTATLRSHVQIKRSFETHELSSSTLAETISALESKRGRLWNPHIPEMVHAYFGDMDCILGGVAASLRAGGRAYAVVGDSRYADVTVPVATVLNELAVSHALEIVSSEPFRSMRASPQQGGRPELRETLLVLRRK